MNTRRIENIFLDDGDVLNDNTLRGPQWRKYIHQYFGEIYGGTLEDWSRANDYAINQYMVKMEEYEKTPSQYKFGYRPFLEEMEAQWYNDMLIFLDHESVDGKKAYQLSIDAQIWICERVQSAIPGAINMVNALHEQGYKIYAASAGASYILKGYYKGMGIADKYVEFYGPDLLNVEKTSIDFYRLMIEHSGVDPEKSVFIDDKPKNLRQAWYHGFNVIQSNVTQNHPRDDEFHTIPCPAFTTYDDLPEILDSMNSVSH